MSQMGPRIPTIPAFPIRPKSGHRPMSNLVKAPACSRDILGAKGTISEGVAVPPLHQNITA
jgi:hypothetical protein